MFPYSDFATLVFIPLILITIRDMKKNWRSLWDNDVTTADRQLLLRVSLILSVTVLTLIHEYGHVLATYHFGGRITAFHFSVLHSWVQREGAMDPTQIVLIAFAGNLLEIIFSLLLIIIACCWRSPPVVTLLIYLGWFGLGNSVVLYPLLSAAGLQGDWVQIYGIPAGHLNLEIGIFHAILLAGFLYASFSDRTKLWFRRRTDLKWDAEYQRWLAQLSTAPSVDGWINLGYTYGRGGLYRLAAAAADHAEAMNPNHPEIARLRAGIAYEKGKYKEVISQSEKVVHDQSLPPVERALSWVNIGHAYRELKDYPKAIESYDAAISTDPFLGLARLAKATLMIDGGDESRQKAYEELNSESTLPLVWSDDSYRAQYQSLLDEARQAVLTPAAAPRD